ncbi:MAG: YdcF family protein [Bacteroidia bacterium]|nr:YdcF family protein [Bacteroidia bacterium]
MTLPKRKTLLLLGIPLLILLVLFLFRQPILRAMGNYLIYNDELEPVEAIFVLAGGAKERGTEAARLYHLGISKHLLCTGEEESIPLANGTWIGMGELTRNFILAGGVDSAAIELIPVGTSTFEEYSAIKDYCLGHGLTKIIILSSEFHTRRVSQVFKRDFAKAGIQAIIRGAPDANLADKEWWQTENGLVFVNNEYIKILYYWVKY